MLNTLLANFLSVLIVPPPSYDIIMFDIDSKDTSDGVVSPPEAFLETNFLASVKSILSPSGL